MPLARPTFRKASDAHAYPTNPSATPSVQRARPQRSAAPTVSSIAQLAQCHVQRELADAAPRVIEADVGQS